MAGSASGHDKVNLVFWLAIRAGFARSGFPRFVPAKAKFSGVIFWPYNKFFTD